MAHNSSLNRTARRRRWRAAGGSAPLSSVRYVARFNAMPWRRAFAIWLVIIAVETAHGVIRTLWLQPLVGDFEARQIATLTGSALILLVAYLFGPWLHTWTTQTLIAVGLFWVVLTVLFECVLGRFLLGQSWERILSDYDVSRGGLMVFGLLFLTLSPLIAARLRMRGSTHRAA